MHCTCTGTVCTEKTRANMMFIVLLLSALCAQIHSVSADVNCTLSHRTGDIVFPFFKCPDNTHCVVSSVGGDTERSPSTINSFVPVGCCPNAQPVHCHNNATTYGHLLGCCQAGSVCCAGTISGQRYLVGCATNAQQCCGTRICEEGYICCNTGKGLTCCPNTTLCRAYDVYVPAEAGVFGLRTRRISSFFNISDSQLCIPADVANVNASLPVEHPYTVVKYPSPQGYAGTEGWYVTDIAETPNVTACGTRMCHNGDTCIHRYKNVSVPDVYRNGTTTECINAKLLNNTAWDIGCFRRVWTTREESYPVGCCAPGKTPCGAHSHTFEPAEINAYISPFLTEEISGCVGENETCCHPYICAAGSKCCTARRQVDGIDINITAFRDAIPFNTFATHNEGHQFCCPEEAFCCEYIPAHAAKRTMSMQAKSIPFCGLDDTCTTNFLGNRRTIYKPRAVRETIPWDADPIAEQLAFRQSLGIVGSPSPTPPPPPPGFANTCYYTVQIGTDPIRKPYVVSCGVLGKGDTVSGAGAILAPNVAPSRQMLVEQLLGGKIPCPSPKPEVWCDSGV